MTDLSLSARAQIERDVAEAKALIQQIGPRSDISGLAAGHLSGLVVHIAALSAALATAERREEVGANLIERLRTILAIKYFEPDEGEPHPLKDGVYDQLMCESWGYLDGRARTSGESTDG